MLHANTNNSLKKNLRRWNSMTTFARILFESQIKIDRYSADSPEGFHMKNVDSWASFG